MAVAGDRMNKASTAEIAFVDGLLLFVALAMAFGSIPYLVVAPFLLQNWREGDFAFVALAGLSLDQVEVIAFSVPIAFHVALRQSLSLFERLLLLAFMLIGSGIAGFFLAYVRGLSGYPPSLSTLLY